MRNFWFNNRTKVVFGRDVAARLGETVREIGTRPLLAYGCASARESGLLDRVRDDFHRHGITAIEHGGVKSNPVVSHVRQGIMMAREAGVDCVVGVGGGSVIDEAKAIAAGVRSDNDIWHYFSSGDKATAALPIVAMPTLAATGSEVNGGVVLKDDDTGAKVGIGSPVFYPAVSLLDPTLTMSVPPDYTAYGVIDACSHALEPYFNGEEKNTPVQDGMTEGIVRALMGIGARLRSSPSDYEARADMMWAACMAHNGLLSSGRGRVRFEIHVIAHAVGALCDLAHGATIAAVTPGWLSCMKELGLRDLDKFARNVMCVDVKMNGSLEDEGIERFRAWMASLGCPVRLRDLGIDASAVAALVANAAPTATSGGMGERELRRIYERCL